jgi:hypothetical protein
MRCRQHMGDARCQLDFFHSGMHAHVDDGGGSYWGFPSSKWWWNYLLTKKQRWKRSNKARQYGPETYLQNKLRDDLRAAKRPR